MAFWRRSRKHPATDPSETGLAPLDNTALVEAMQAVAVNDSEQSRATLFRSLLDARPWPPLNPHLPRFAGWQALPNE